MPKPRGVLRIPGTTLATLMPVCAAVAKPRRSMRTASQAFSTRCMSSIVASARNTPSSITGFAKKTRVYVLELSDNYIYVGQSQDVAARIQQHMQGKGAKFTRLHKPTGKQLPRLGSIEGSGDSGEREETLLQMRKHGIDRVRGWRYVSDKISARQLTDIRENFKEMFNLCRICMSKDHMASACSKKNMSRL